MDIIRRKTDYGLRALVAIAQAQRAMRAEELAAAEEVPVAFLHKALTQLANAGILVAQRGPAGGFTLARAAGEITVLEAVETLQGPVEVSRCLLGEDSCTREESCGLRWAWEKVQQNIASFLRGLTVQELVESLGQPACRGNDAAIGAAPERQRAHAREMR